MIDVSYTPPLHGFMHLLFQRRILSKHILLKLINNLKSKLEKIIMVLVLIFDNVIVFAKCLKVTRKKNKYSILSNDINESDFINALGNIYKFY